MSKKEVVVGMWNKAPFFRSVKSATENVNRILDKKDIPLSYKVLRNIEPGESRKKNIDLIILDGGADINPERYGRKNTFSSYNNARDAAEFSIMKRYFGYIPISGICRGMQLINVFSGGTMIQDIFGETRIRHGSSHTVKVSNNLDFKYGDADFMKFMNEGDEFSVSSYHHQALSTMGRNLRAILFCKYPDQGFNIVEGIEHKEGYARGVQSHPEFNTKKNDPILFSYLLFIDIFGKDFLISDEINQSKLESLEARLRGKKRRKKKSNSPGVQAVERLRRTYNE